MTYYLEADCRVLDKDNFGEHISLPLTALFINLFYHYCYFSLFRVAILDLSINLLGLPTSTAVRKSLDTVCKDIGFPHYKVSICIILFRKLNDQS